jgi:hypothetical protein
VLVGLEGPTVDGGDFGFSFHDDSLFLCKGVRDFGNHVLDVVFDLLDIFFDTFKNFGSVCQLEGGMDAAALVEFRILRQVEKGEKPAAQNEDKGAGQQEFLFRSKAKHLLSPRVASKGSPALVLDLFSPRALIAALLPSFLEAGIEVGLFFGRDGSAFVTDAGGASDGTPHSNGVRLAALNVV